MIFTNKVQVKTSEGNMQLLTELEEFVVNFIMPIVLVAICAGIFAFYISPTHKKLPQLKSEVDAKTQEVAILQAKVDQLTALERNKGLLIEDLTKMSWALEERDKVPELTQQVKAMSDDSKVAFVSLEYANANRSEVSTVVAPSSSLTPDPGLYKEEKVDVSIKMTDLAGSIEFLKATEKSIRLFRVESLKISVRPEESNASLVMASPYLNPTFSAYSETAAPIDLTNPTYRQFMSQLDNFRNYAKEIDATLPKI